MKQLVCANQCIAIGKVGCEVGILCGPTWAAMDEIVHSLFCICLLTIEGNAGTPASRLFEKSVQDNSF
jgi:hypothetical protein